MKYWLLDTGPIVAFLDASDSQHTVVADALESFDGRLVTTTAVIVEAMHLLGSIRTGPALAVEFLTSSRTEIHEFSSIGDLVQAVELMEKYADTPMDFADATLVMLGTRLKIYDVCTLDRRGFRSYRIGRRAFRLVLDEHS